jgi:hypothetical protein
MQAIKVNFVLSGELLERYNRYAQLTDQSIKEAAKEALEDWMDTVGEGDIEVNTGCIIDSEAERMGLPVAACVPNATLLN